MARKTTLKENGASKAGAKNRFRPTRDAVLEFITDNPDQAGKREIARAFGLKGADRVWLKDMLHDLADEGLLEKKGKRVARPGSLPPVAVLDIFGRDAQGGLLARPNETREEDGPAPLVSIKIPRNARGPMPGVGERVLAKIFASKNESGPAYQGRVIRVIDKRRDSALGIVREAPDGTFRLEPVERRQPELVIDKAQLTDAQPGDLVEAEPLRHGRYGLAKGKIVQVIGSMASEKAISMIAIHAHEIPHIFSSEVLEEAEALEPAGMKGREDWRSVPLVTIDPATAKDHDDAVHAEQDTDENNRGGVIATVAIADVAAYIRAGSPIDREALKRGNSVYFPDRVVPMLPERISNDLCSLRAGEDRPALAVRMIFASDGRKLRHSFHRIMMRAHAGLAYEAAQAAIDGKPDAQTGPLLDSVLEPLWEAYKILSRGRRARAPLELDLPERRIVLKEDGTVDRVEVPERLDAHKLIEEFMIQANVSAAETLEAKKQALVYRSHDAPTLAKQESLREFLASLSISLARGAQMKPAQFNTILERAADGAHGELVAEMVLRSQSQAIYTIDNLGHFGLNLRRYAHFTSPIRRYADLIVHRGLIAALGLGSDGLTAREEERLEEVSALISATERRAMAAERDTVDRLIAAHLSDRINETFSARISGVTKSGLFVQLPTYGADGFVPISMIGDDYYVFDETIHALTGQESGKGYQLADQVEVRLVEVAPMAGAMRFEILSEPKPLPGSRQSFHKGRRRPFKNSKARGRSARSRR